MAKTCPEPDCGRDPVREFIRGEPDWPEGEKSRARVLHTCALGHRWTAEATDFPPDQVPSILRS